MSDICDTSATEQKELLDSRSISAVELLEAHLDRINAVNPSVNAVVALDAAVGRRAASAIDGARMDGDEVGSLAGLVTAHKDLTDTVDFPTTYGSPVHAGVRPSADSLLVSRMKRAGAVAVGKTNTPELGAGSHTFNPVYGTTLNPWDLGRSAGGSSGGAAVALATGMVGIADGSDMGGSLRNPAAWNNVVGFRSSPGLVPRIERGVSHSTLGVEGAMARTVDDLALLLSVIGAPDLRDPLNRGLEVPATIAPIGRPLRVAFSPDLGGLPFEPDIGGVIEKVVALLPTLGWSVELAEPDFSGADECFATLRSFLFATGKLHDRTDNERSQVKATVQEEYRRGQGQSSQEIADAYGQLQQLWRRSVEFFQSYDLLVAPVTQISPFPAELEYPTSVNGEPCERYIDWMRSVCRVTVLGLPALSLPAGFTDEGLPVGVQIIGGPYADLDVLAAAKVLESVTEHHKRRPPILG